MGKWDPMRVGQISAAFLFAIGFVVFASCPMSSLGQTPRRRGVMVPKPTPENAPKSGTYYALIIGIKDYQFYPQLETPINDANEVAAVLKEQYGFKTHVLPDATHDQILDELGHYRSELQEDDNLLIYYAGHGNFDKLSDLAYWFPKEAGKASTARWINASEITGQVRAIAARHVLVIADSCYSGMMTRAASPTLDAPQDRDEYLRKLLAQKSRHVMSSGGNEPVSDNDTPGHPRGHSVFANALLQGLREFREDEFSAEELFNQYIREQVGGRSQQLPEYNPIRDSDHNGGGFVFLRSRGLPAPAINDVVIPAAKVDLIETPVYRPRHHVNPDEPIIRAALQRYEDAYESMDIELMKAVWPTLSKAQIEELRKGFRGAQAVKVQMQNCEIPTNTTDSARVRCDQTMTYTRDGKRQPEQRNPVDVSLKKGSGGSWLVADVHGVQ